MTKVRRLVQLLEDLEKLRVITADQYRTLPGLQRKQIMIVMEVPDDYYDERVLIEEAIEAEFSEEAKIIKDSKVIQVLV